MTSDPTQYNAETEWSGSLQTFVSRVIPTGGLPDRRILLGLMDGLYKLLLDGTVRDATELKARVEELIRLELKCEPNLRAIQVVTEALLLAHANQSDLNSALQFVLESQ